MTSAFLRLLALGTLLGTTLVRGTAPMEADLVVYGGTSGGVAAAVAAARLGKSVILLTQNTHVGGMTASGLGVTDRGNTASIGGIAREFYLRVGQQYGSASPVYFFEPGVAERVFRQMLAEAGVPVHTNKLLMSVTKLGSRLDLITMADGSSYRAGMFVDTTYEGDLMAAAGVSFTVGREGTNAFKESLAGIRPLGGAYNYDPYVTPGSPGSGLLKFVQPGNAGTVGQGDHRLQAYNFRLCLTQNVTNQIAIAPPASYSANDYELFARYVEARVAKDGTVNLDQLIHLQTIIPNGKTDINANGELSTDWVGGSDTWATNTHAGRALLRQQHEDYIRGMLYFYATSPRVPLNVRTQMQSWGLAKDEFPDNGGWPWQIYVREGRRMVSGYIMTQSNAESRVTVPDGIALASYAIDSHGVQRLASGGYARWEGSIGGTPPYPYPISYRSIVPRSGECENLLCTFALSASHVAFASCRMEPVFMMTSQSAATAAALALDDQVAVQQLSYSKLSAQLRADGHLLSWEATTYTTNGIILDQGGPGTASAGSWTAGANAGGWNADYWHDGAAGKGAKWVQYTPTLPTNGTYEVYAWWVENANRATNTPFDITHNQGTTRVLVNQRLASTGWFKLITTNFTAAAGQGVTLRNEGTAAGSYVIADGVRFLPVGGAVPPALPPVVEVVASDALAGEFNTNRARFSIVRQGATNAPLAVQFTLTGSASLGADYLPLPLLATIPAGSNAVSVTIIPMTDALAEGEETVVLNLISSPNYTLTSLSNAMIRLRDRPADAWRAANFTPPELAQPEVSGDGSDPDGDGLPNLVECALGLTPQQADGAGRPFASVVNGELRYTFTLSKSAVDLSVIVQASEDLTQWSGAVMTEMARDDLGSVWRVTLRADDPVAAGAQRYLRLRVNRL